LKTTAGTDRGPFRFELTQDIIERAHNRLAGDLSDFVQSFESGFGSYLSRGLKLRPTTCCQEH
jgi:hypothetical protein